MPIEALTREEVEVVEEKLRKLVTDMQISKRISDLEASDAKVIEAMNELLSAREGRTVEASPLATALTSELGLVADQLQILTTSDSVTLKPIAFETKTSERSGRLSVSTAVSGRRKEECSSSQETAQPRRLRKVTRCGKLRHTQPGRSAAMASNLELNQSFFTTSLAKRSSA